VALAKLLTWADRLAQSSTSVIKLFAIGSYPRCSG
jgi:hypothetical protein